MKRVLATLLALSAPVQAQVSSTAAPVANSSGSVTNQAVQVYQAERLLFNIQASVAPGQHYISIHS